MYRIGIDLGGTNIVAGIIDENNKIVAKASRKTNAPRAAEAIFDDMAAAVKEAMAQLGITNDDVISIGVGTPGSVNKELELIEFANNLGFDNVPAYKLLRERTGIEKVWFDNDANCAALGEAVAGCGKGVKDFIMITLGTGVGSGIIVNGKLVTGLNYAAGEMGHTVIVYNGEQCNCGRRGCWERYSSATALITQTKDAMRKNSSSTSQRSAAAPPSTPCARATRRPKRWSISTSATWPAASATSSTSSSRRSSPWAAASATRRKTCWTRSARCWPASGIPSTRKNRPACCPPSWATTRAS